MAVTRETLRLTEELRDAVSQIVDTQTRDLVQAWAIAWDEVSRDLHDTLLELATARDDGRITRGMVARSRRLHTALAVIGDRLDGLAAAAGVRIVGDLDRVIAVTREAQEQLIGSQFPPVSPLLVTQPGAEALDAIVARATEQITALTLPLSPRAYAAVRRELIRGVAAGSNPRETARRMVQRTEHRFNGGLTRALVIARTETLDAHREAARVAHEANAEVLAGWVWSATLDVRTCPACWGMHGDLFDVAEPGPLGHQQCRCARLPKTKSWSELGFDVDEPPDLTPDADARFTSLGPADQLEILGPKRYAAWVAGEHPMTAWAVRRSTDGWRDSYVVAGVGDVGAGRTGGGGGSAGPAGTGGPPDEGPHSIGRSITVATDRESQTLTSLVDHAVALIDSVHLVDRDLPPIRISAMTEPLQLFLPGVQGFYKHDEGSNPFLQVKPDGTRLDLTLIHELGHALDDLLFGPGSSEHRMGTEEQLSTVFADWWDTVRATQAIRTLDEMLLWDPDESGPWSTVTRLSDGREATWDPEGGHVTYLRRVPEVFGRAYVQWIATETGDQTLLDQLTLDIPNVPAGYELIAGRVPMYPVHWDAEDFAPVAAAMRRLFTDLLTDV